jgi:hypothetical protein
MHRQLPVSDPFALLMDPDRVLRAMEQSERLSRLQRRICCPLDNPQIAPKVESPEASESVDKGLSTGLEVWEGDVRMF